MASKTQPLASSSSLFIFFLALLSTFITSSNATDSCAGSGSISVYWGQHTDEGSLKDTCDSGNYNIVIIETLTVHEDGRDPTLNLENHCGTPANPCSNLESEIKHCQNNSIKVFISIGSDSDESSPPENIDLTKELAESIANDYLNGNSGPLGSVSLDGVDIQDVSDSRHIHWAELVTFLGNGSVTARKIYVSASPQCVYPDQLLNEAIETGYVDYIWVEFYYYNPACIYADGSAENLLNAWETWTENVPNSLIFLGITADKGLAGYMEPDVVNSEILPSIKTSSNYGGVMIWDRYSDINNDNYSAKIKDSVPKTCKCVCDVETSSTRRRFDKLKLARS